MKKHVFVSVVFCFVTLISGFVLGLNLRSVESVAKGAEMATKLEITNKLAKIFKEEMTMDDYKGAELIYDLKATGIYAVSVNNVKTIKIAK